MADRPSLVLRGEAWTALAVLRAGLWLAPFRLWRDRFAGLLCEAAVPAPEERAEARRMTQAVAQAARRVPRATCLVQALALRWMLRRRGISCDLRVGVSRSERGEFEAHAWIECGGELLIGGGPAARFTPLRKQ